MFRFDVSKLDTNTITYLVSGQFLLRNIDASDDYSPVIIQYGRAIENELKRIFLPINPSVARLLGLMQGSLEKFKNIPSTMGARSNVDYGHIPGKLTTMFQNPQNSKVELLNGLRLKRNDAGHAGHTKTKQYTLEYFQKANEFLDSWINEKVTQSKIFHSYALGFHHHLVLITHK